MNPTTGRERNRVIDLIPFTGERLYQVAIAFGEKTIRFQIRLACLGPAGRNQFLYTISRDQVYINNLLPGPVIERLADGLGRFLYPLVLRVDEPGFINDIVNHADLVRNWEQNGAHMAHNYCGAVAEKIFHQFNRNIRHKEKLIQALGNDWFFAVYFSGIYGIKPYDFRDLTPIDLPLMPGYGPVRYDVTREIMREPDEAGCLLIECYGQPRMMSRQPGLFFRSPRIPEGGGGTAEQDAGVLRMCYRLYRRDFSIQSITCQAQLKEPGGKLRQVRVEICHRPESQESSDSR